MNRKFLKLAVIIGTCLLVTWLVHADVNIVSVAEPNAAIKEHKAAIIVCKGLIDDGLYKSIRRRTQEALDMGAEYLIYEIETYGGLLQAADDIAKYFILEVGKKAHTVAYINTEAISAGAMISVSCQDIIMRENTTIGDCAPIAMGQAIEGVEREKMESFTRAAFDRASEANGYPQALLRAMVSIQIAVYRIKNLQTQQYEFFEGERLPRDPNLYDLDNKELIVKDDEILTLTASRAFEYGIARAVVKDIDEAIAYLSQRDGVKISKDPVVLTTNWSEEMVRLINSPAVVGVLFLIALLGIYIELNTPGVGLPGLVAVTCFAIIIGSKYLIGLANWVEVAVFVIGIILLLVEFFILPGFGIAGILGIICIIAGLFGMLVRNQPHEIPWPQTPVDWQIFTDGALGLLIGFVAFLVIAALLTKFLPKFSAFSGLALEPTPAKTGQEYEVSSTSVQGQANQLKVGDVGQTLTMLRPTGKAKFGDSVVEVLCKGEFLDKGTKVEIIEIKGNRVIVRTA
ncbi:MAG: NfeD family protein [Phycisphaerae bacterium]